MAYICSNCLGWELLSRNGWAFDWHTEWNGLLAFASSLSNMHWLSGRFNTDICLISSPQISYIVLCYFRILQLVTVKLESRASIRSFSALPVSRFWEPRRSRSVLLFSLRWHQSAINRIYSSLLVNTVFLGRRCYIIGGLLSVLANHLQISFAFFTGSLSKMV